LWWCPLTVAPNLHNQQSARPAAAGATQSSPPSPSALSSKPAAASTQPHRMWCAAQHRPRQPQPPLLAARAPLAAQQQQQRQRVQRQQQRVGGGPARLSGSRPRWQRQARFQEAAGEASCMGMRTTMTSALAWWRCSASCRMGRRGLPCCGIRRRIPHARRGWWWMMKRLLVSLSWG